MRAVNRKFDDPLLAERIAELHAAQRSQREIASALGIVRKTIREVMRHNGWQPGPIGVRRGTCPALVARIASLYATGLSQENVGLVVGLTRSGVGAIMRRFALEIRHEAPPRGEKSHKWKGPAAKYTACHNRVRRERGTPSRCEDCGTTSAKRFEWANLTGRYHDVNDYRRLCSRCHSRFDTTVHSSPGFTGFHAAHL